MISMLVMMLNWKSIWSCWKNRGIPILVQAENLDSGVSCNGSQNQSENQSMSTMKTTRPKGKHFKLKLM